MRNNTITQEELKRHLDYDPLTGIFTRKISNSPNTKIGDVAGTKHKGYIEIKINKKQYSAHRLAWLYVYGYFPENEIDHIDNNPKHRHHNWISNLREASSQCQQRNQRNQRNNISGVKGINWHKKSNRWTVQMCINYKKIYLGIYKDFDEAVCVRLAVEQCVNWEGCDSNSPAYQYVQKMLSN